MPNTTPTSMAAQTFVWDPKDWVPEREFTRGVYLLENKTTRGRKVFKKELVGCRFRIDPISKESIAAEVWFLKQLPDCNRIVKHLYYSFDPIKNMGTAIFQHYPLGDAHDWMKDNFTRKYRGVPESHIWRFFIQISQSLAFIQGKIGPNSSRGEAIIHRDIKLKNILVVDNGSTYPSFKLHDFGVATTWKKSAARQPAYVGSFQWQPPENPMINCRAADIWSLGACVHYLATGRLPTKNVDYYRALMLEANNGEHPSSAQPYHHPRSYYQSRIQRHVTPINLDPVEQEQIGLPPNGPMWREYWNIQYSDELNHWMHKCLVLDPTRRVTAGPLCSDMPKVGKALLQKMGREAALTDLDIEYGPSA
ncbi:serine/threonine protein kinase-like protein [Phaeosphaeriaceae sp. PMI808]|nr:serine/threonine protein kinase-like protein [Phaeosphaeriaceae sp. PMI808]